MGYEEWPALKCQFRSLDAFECLECLAEIGLEGTVWIHWQFL